MAAYAALISLMHIIEQIEHHPHPPISLDEKQVQSLTTNVTFLQDFLESYSSIGKTGGDSLERQIQDAAYAAEDVIESRIVDLILTGSTNKGDPVEFGQLLQIILEDMDLIKSKAVEIKEKIGFQQQLQRNSASSYIGEKDNTTMVGLGNALLEIMEKLVGGGGRKIIPMVGMGGIGKTTLARNVYKHPFIREHFDILAWTTISQKYNSQKILSEILYQANRDKEILIGKNEQEMGDYLYKYLFGRKYLIVLDDIWNIEAWEKIKFFFPDNSNGSRIVVTTRISKLARQLSCSYALHLKFLGMDESWDLFSKIVFPKKGACHPKILEIGKKIVENCKGLPLSIVVVGGFLAKSEYKREVWEHIERNLNFVVNSDNDEHCFKILQLSYNQLPVHLKPCFLYMGVFKEDSETRVSKLVKLWVAEGFVKPINGKNLEDVAKEYLNDLVDRNLMLIVKNGGKRVKIHDLLRDLCVRQIQAERFRCVTTQHSISIPQHRSIVSEATSKEDGHNALLSRPLAHPSICNSLGFNPSSCPRLLRVFGACDDDVLVINDDVDDDDYFQENKFQLVNLRYIVALCLPNDSKFATSFHLLWNLQSLFIKSDYNEGFAVPAEIWNMPQLRHVEAEGYLKIPDPPICNGQDNIVLENLQTLTLVRNFKCREEMVKRIPNLRKLNLVYVGNEIEESCLNNLDRLHKLKYFECRSRLYHKPDGIDCLHKLSFPPSLKKLALKASHVHWENMLEKIGLLPHLQKLELSFGFFATHKWETVEGQFQHLKSLKISYCTGLVYWYSEPSHFPCLEHLVLCELDVLNEIPSGIGEIPTLQSIELYYCNKSVVISSKKIQEEHEELYGNEEAVGVRVQLSGYEGLQDFASRNFELVE